MKLRRLYDAEHALWSMIQSYGYKLDGAMAYRLADEHFKKYNQDFDLIENYDADSPELETGIEPEEKK